MAQPQRQRQRYATFQHATCSMQHATCNMQHAASSSSRLLQLQLASKFNMENYSLLPLFNINRQRQRLMSNDSIMIDASVSVHHDATTTMQHTYIMHYAIWNTNTNMGRIVYAECSMQHAACSMQHGAWSLELGAWGLGRMQQQAPSLPLPLCFVFYVCLPLHLHSPPALTLAWWRGTNTRTHARARGKGSCSPLSAGSHSRFGCTFPCSLLVSLFDVPCVCREVGSLV